MDTVHLEHAWSDDLVERLRFLSEAFANGIERWRLEVALAERLALNRMLASMSATFSAVSAVDFDREVKEGLRRIAAVIGIDHGAVIELSRDGKAGRTWASDDGPSSSARCLRTRWRVSRRSTRCGGYVKIWRISAGCPP